MSSARIILKKGRERSINRYHPWVFSGAIHSKEGNPQEGDVVEVYDHQKNCIAIAHFSESSLAAKVLDYKKVEIDKQWYSARLEKALSLRRSLGFPNAETNAFRLVHGEGDGLPGLIVDVYNDVLVVQPHSKGMERDLDLISESLQDLGFKNAVYRPVSKNKPSVLFGSVSGRVRIKEDGLDYNVDVLQGQKTGFFLDQRDNRALLSAYSEGRSVLNAFSYTGGFSMAAIKGGAESAISLDASASALEIAEENAQINGYSAQHRSVKSDAIKYLQSMNDRFDLIVLDPPAFAKHKSARHNAIQAYRRINQAAIEHLESGGILFTFSCSQVITMDLFKGAVESALIEAGKRVQILHTLQQPSDHPVLLSHPEGSYLKGLVLRVFDGD